MVDRGTSSRSLHATVAGASRSSRSLHATVAGASRSSRSLHATVACASLSSRSPHATVACASRSSRSLRATVAGALLRRGGAVATAALSFDPVGPLASWGYIYGRTHEETQNVVDTVEGINEAGDMWSRTAERFQNLFGGHGFVTEEQQEAVRAREAAQ